MLRYTLRQLEYFVAVGEAGSISLASEKVNVSSPSISAAINQLEKEFGLPLFVRQHAQGLSLSQAGRRMLVQAKLVLKNAEGLMALAGDISGVVRGPLAVGCLMTFAQVVLPSVRKSFETENPEVDVSQYELDQSAIFNQLRRAEIDVALTYDLNLPADLQFVSLLELPPYALVDETHPLAHLSEVSVTTLKDHPMVLLDLPFSADYFLSFFSQADVTPNIAERTKDMAVMRSLVANGFGYSIANVRPVNDRSPDGKLLKFIPLVGDVRPMRLGCLMSQDADTSSVVRAFVDHCVEQLKNDNFAGLEG
ncbi:LysR family transcriptional regulator [Shimia thalassica]|jgi:DNA-binding transcriptional LysR family regulator|uniref:Hca operon transcriptional activator n=1 Tax=Shimia thalassica TaxID=1715693 RepID=A0A0P1IMZ8_9RHOB|nr:LysR family transcriptional regulator [Shimia thalassica]MBU2944756.1 LysR family transcriptional regulator [Shimia thalassica]MDO6479253.1 LysR family transcriptional regulator [Shimia thalassica]MDO6482281.1 LysR family transcriptional regulator [Shimia thalassica]MDO6501898.1 LysR family transcriptional regulator [Shimia thalassica]MDO6797043.1 LysR family transcriptional regulator [Shimia thalassica]